MLVDTHCHLNFHAFKKDLDDVVRRALIARVEKMIVPGTDIASSRRAVEVAKKYSGVCFAAVGIHPHHAQNPNLKLDNVRHQVGELLKNREVVALGETGLDYYHYKKTKYDNSEITSEIIQKQKQLLLLQLDLAVIHKKPVILHCREAHNDMIDLLRSFNLNISRSSLLTSTTDKNISPVKTNYIKPYIPRGVWHCFGGNAKHLSTIHTMGYYVGWDGNITYSDDYSPLVKSTPLEKLLIETDAPFLTPIPLRGQRNEPQNIPIVAQAIANYHSSPLSEIISHSTQNAQKLFSI